MVVEAAQGPLGEVLARVDTRFPGFKERIVGPDGQLSRAVNLYVNDEDARYLAQLDTQVADRDVISLLPAVAGG